MGITGLALPLMARPGIFIGIGAPAPVVTVTVPAPVVVVSPVPDTYVWDGAEYVGVVGGQYYYLGPGNLWLVMDPTRLARFHAWAKVHADWRSHAVQNEKYRQDAHGHVAPMHDAHGQGHDYNNNNKNHNYQH